MINNKSCDGCNGQVKHSAILGDTLALHRLSGTEIQRNNIMSRVITAVRSIRAVCPFRSLTPKMSRWKTNLLESLQLVLGGRGISITTALSVEELGEAGLRPLAIEVDDGVVAQLVPDGRELLAMSTPRGIKLNQHVLLGIHGDLVEVLADQNLYASRVPVLGNLLRHQVLLQLSSQELGNKGLDIFGLDLVVLRLVLCHVLSQLDGSEGRQLGFSNSEELENPLVVILIGVDGDEEHLALVLLGDTLQHGHVVGVRVGLGAEEGEEVRLDVA